MGKRIREKEPDMSTENSSSSHHHHHHHHHHYHSGRVWGILHLIKYHHWRHVKKRLTHKKHSHAGGRNDARAGAPGTSDDSGVNNMQEHYEPNATLSIVEQKPVHSTPPAKHSIKSRLKALITEEISRKKGRHKRSSTCPAKSQLNRADSLHQLELDPANKVSLTVESREPVLGTFENHHAADTLNVLPPVFSEKPSTNNDKCVDCGTMFTSDNLEHNQIHNHQKQWTNVKNFGSPHQFVPEEKLINAKILTTDASPQLFKDFHDALHIINSNKDFLLKFLQDPASPLASHFHNQQAFSGQMRLTKSVSFPVSGSSSGSKDSEPVVNKMVDDWFNAKGERQLQIQKGHMKNVSQSESSEDFHQQSMSSGSTHKVDQFLNQDEQWVERDYNSSSVSSQVPNHVATKHFKELKKKIKHLIEEDKKERHRIAMDAILDKVPQGKKPSKNVMKLTHDQSKDPTISGEGNDSGFGSRLSSYSFNKRQLSSMRTTSLKESVGRYSQLYETCFNRKVKHPKPEGLKLKTEERSSILRTPKSFRRFLSMPNLKANFHQSEEPLVILSPQNSIRQLGERITSTSVTDDQRSFDHSDSESQVLPHTLADDTIQESISNGDLKQLVVRSVAKSESDVNNEEKAKKSIKIDGLGNLRESDDGAACNEQDTGPAIESASMPAEANSVSLSDSSFLDDIIDFEKFNVLEELKLWPGDGLDNMAEQEEPKVDDPEVDGSGENFQKFRILSKRFNYEMPCVEVDASNEDEFKYVKDVLELSGFTSSESLGLWYSDDQPVDPSVYEQLEGCLLLDPDCSGICDGGQCNHLLLFDLINEGLLEIYGRSYSYYPKPLSSLSHVHPLPAGDHVLHKVWAVISWYLNSGSEVYPSLDYYVSRDLAKNDGWMNLQFDSECVGLELDDMIFDDLLEEIICT